MSVHGADIEALRHLQQEMQRAANQINSVVRSVSSSIHAVNALWHGPDSAQFITDWRTNHSPKLSRATTEMQKASDTIGAQADAQQQTSDADGMVPGGGASPVVPFAGRGPALAGGPSGEELAALAASIPNGDPRSPQAERLREALEGLIDDPDARAEVYNLLVAGVPADIALATATGDWSEVEGGDPALYDENQIDLVLRTAGLGSDIDADAARELFAAIDDPSLVAQLFQEGWGFETSVQPGLASPGSLVLPFGATASVDATVSTSLSDPSIGVGFTQTNQLEVNARVVGEVEGYAGKSTLGRLYGRINQLSRYTGIDVLPPAVRATIANNPLLDRALRGVPFSVAYAEYAGTELAYEATLTSDQVDAGVVPNIFDPTSLEPGNSFLIRGGAVEGSTFEAKYKLLEIQTGTENFDGVGFGVTVLDDGRVAVFSGDIDAVETRGGIGVPVAHLVDTDRRSNFVLDYAELDLATPEGQAAYAEFVSGGGVPDADTAGVVTATSERFTQDTDLAIEAGPFSHELNSENYSYETLNYSDGRQVVTADASFGDHALQLTAPHGADGQIDYDQAEIVIVMDGLDHYDANAIGWGYGADYPSGEDYAVQVSYTADELIDLQGFAATAVENGSTNGFAERIAAADSVEGIINVLTTHPDAVHHESLVLGLQEVAVLATPDGPPAALPGSFEARGQS